MTALREAAQQALEACTDAVSGWQSLAPLVVRRAAEESLDALRAALAEPRPIHECYGDCPTNPQTYPNPCNFEGRPRPVQEPVTNNPDPYHLSRILHELAGSASMCWEHVERAGVFESTQAAEFVAAAIAEIRQRIKADPPQRKPLTDETLWEMWVESPSDVLRFARAIERAHGI